jgi:hypothetical protein
MERCVRVLPPPSSERLSGASYVPRGRPSSARRERFITERFLATVLRELSHGRDSERRRASGALMPPDAEAARAARRPEGEQQAPEQPRQ